jgi:hypothetical protein
MERISENERASLGGLLEGWRGTGWLQAQELGGGTFRA